MRSDAKTLLAAHIFGASAIVEEALKNSDRHLPQNPRWKKSNAPYYKLKYGEKLKETFDLLLADKTRIIIWRLENSSSLNTLYLRYHQGREYLIDHMDPDCKYLDAIAHIKTKKRHKEEPKGLIFFWEDNHEPEPDAVKVEEFKEVKKEEIVKPKELSWRNKLENFIEKAEDSEKLRLNKVEATEGNRQIVEGMMAALPNFYYMFIPEVESLILIRCDDPERMNELKKTL